MPGIYTLHEAGCDWSSDVGAVRGLADGHHLPTGAIETTRPVNTAGTTQTFGGLGLRLTPAEGSTTLPGTTTVHRVTGTALDGMAGGESIHRYFGIEATTNTNLDVTLAFDYRDDELSGTPESQLTFGRGHARRNRLAGGPLHLAPGHRLGN